MHGTYQTQQGLYHYPSIGVTASIVGKDVHVFRRRLQLFVKEGLGLTHELLHICVCY